MLQRELLYAALGTGFTCLATVLGAGMVFFFKKEMSHTMQKVFLGFAAGVMIAASVWSLLIPAMEMAEGRGQSVILPVGGGFVLGGLFLMALDRLLPHLHIGSDEAEGLPAHWKRTTMSVLAVTLHNIPEGMAVGLSFSVAAREGGALAGAVALALGMGLQNFPEGAAVSVPLRREGWSRGRSFLVGQASALVEPVAGVLGAWLVLYVQTLLPYALSFAAGAMILVAVHELIPECQKNQSDQPYFATMGIVLGFAAMMLLDVMLG